MSNPVSNALYDVQLRGPRSAKAATAYLRRFARTVHRLGGRVLDTYLSPSRSVCMAKVEIAALHRAALQACSQVYRVDDPPRNNA